MLLGNIAVRFAGTEAGVGRRRTEVHELGRGDEARQQGVPQGVGPGQYRLGPQT